MVVNFGTFGANNQIACANAWEADAFIKEVGLREAVSRVVVTSLSIVDVVFVRAPQYTGEALDSLVMNAMAGKYKEGAKSGECFVRVPLSAGNLLVNTKDKTYSKEWQEKVNAVA